MKRTVPFTCRHCGNTFHRPPSRARNGRGKTCSRECMYASLTRRPKDYGTNWHAQRAACRRRDRRSCRRCGSSAATPDVHHKIPIRLWENKNAANDLDNLVCLCRSCHQTVERATTWVPTDGGVISFATGGAVHEMARAAGLLEPREPDPRNAEEDAINYAIAVESSKPASERNWAAIFDLIANRARLHHVEGRSFTPRESLRAAEPPRQRALFEIGAVSVNPARQILALQIPTRDQ